MQTLEQIRKQFFDFCIKTFECAIDQQNPHFFALNLDRAKANFGDLSSTIALTLAKEKRIAPRAIAEQIKAEFISSHIKRIEVAGPGFVNFFFTQEAFTSIAQELFLEKSSYFQSQEITKKKINIEFVSANPTGPLHFGHGRGGIIGDTLARLLTFLGHTVTREFYINDAGAQIQKLGASLKARCLEQLGINTAIPEDGYHGTYLIDLASTLIKEKGKTVEQKDDEFFALYAKEKMLELIQKTLTDYNISFDVWFSEKKLHESGQVSELLEELKSKGFLYHRDSAWWFASTRFGDDKDRVVERGTGEVTYIAADIAYLKNKLSRQFEELVMVLGHDHHGYIARLQASLAALGGTEVSLRVILYQLVKITKEGALVRMSKRAGTMATLQDIIDAVGVDVARFFYLQKKADAPLEFDLELALKKTEENPVYYIQYAYVRIVSILARAAQMENLRNLSQKDTVLLSEAEHQLLKRIASLKELCIDIAQNYHTHLLAQYALDLAADFHQYYAHHTVVSETDHAQSRARLLLLVILKETFELLFSLLGISAPQKM